MSATERQESNQAAETFEPSTFANADNCSALEVRTLYMSRAVKAAQDKSNATAAVTAAMRLIFVLIERF